jgi:diaminohydroxyphosphoribosylaminopyrimidine deaminase/5-amino-6-(5-phosphoribosylamino)uracil reductase
MGSPAELAAMRRAVALAAEGLGHTSPNPSVGCVLLDPSGTPLGEGRTAPPGGPHAEVAALTVAGSAARGATAVVTLEPCNHTGRTGPCVEALIAAGVARVVVALPDPNPTAAGGTQRLLAAGVQVETGVLAEAARQVLRPWLTAVSSGRPYLVWKYAATLDGRSAAADGSSRWISSPQARAEVHQLRSRTDAIIAGVGTVLADDAHLTVRGPDGTPAARQPLRVVVDSSGRTPAAARVRDGAAPTWVVTAAEVGAGPDGRVDLDKLMAALYHRGVRYALLEGGPTLAGAFLRAGAVDEIIGYVAPKLLGAGTAALGPAGVASIDEAIQFRLADVARVGDDVRLTARREA